MTNSLMRDGLSSFLRWQSLRFLLVGAGNTLFAYGAYAALVYAGFSVPVASLLALLAGVCMSFFSQGRLVFGNMTAASFARFVIAWSLLYALYVAVVLGLERYGINVYAGGLVATGVNALISFFVLRDLVFRPRGSVRTD